MKQAKQVIPLKRDYDKSALNKPVYDFFKRVFDVVASLMAIILLSPVLAIVAIAVKAHDGGPVLYVSERVGKGGKPFKFYKFRSMCVDADKYVDELQSENETGGPTFKITNDPRVTKIGRFIRKTSLDELPQFFNILKGDMSFVGPRPPIPREVEQYDEAAMKRLDIVGGLTCYWQVMGRSSIEFDGMVSLDLKYIEERSFLTDLKILFMTVPAVLKGDGAY